MLDMGSKTKFTVSIEGNIGCGKSTLLQHFSDYNTVEVLQEPVDKWRDVKGHNLYDMMFKDPCRWGHTYQVYVQMTMLELHLAPTAAPVKLMERSLQSARYCFVENLYSTKKMSDLEYAVYCKGYETLTQNLDVDVDLIVYLQADPTKVLERIKRRARSEEQTISLQYLEDLHRYHEEWLIEKKYGHSTPVLVLDANEDLLAMVQKYEEHAADILCKNLVETNNEDEEGACQSPSAVAATANKCDCQRYANCSFK